jgi:hypothetical protein
MDEGTQKINLNIREVLFEDWLTERKETLSQLVGKLSVLQTRPTDTSWDVEVLNREKTLLDEIIKPLWLTVRKLKEENEKLRQTLEARDKEITDILDKTGNWIKHYQPILNKLEKEDQQLIKVKKK